MATKCKKKLDISEDSDIPKAVQYGDFAENGDLKKVLVQWIPNLIKLKKN